MRGHGNGEIVWYRVSGHVATPDGWRSCKVRGDGEVTLVGSEGCVGCVSGVFRSVSICLGGPPKGVPLKGSLVRGPWGSQGSHPLKGLRHFLAYSGAKFI